MDRRWDKSKPPRGLFALNRDCLQAQGLVGWWPMGGPSSGQYVPDMAGKRHLAGTAVSLARGRAGEPVATFVGASSSVLQASTVPVYAAPLSVGIWFMKTTAASTTEYGLVSFGDADGANRFQYETYGGSLRWLAVQAGGTVGPATQTGIVSGKWHHALGIEVSSNSRYAALDGVVGSQDTTAATPGGAPTRLSVGAIVFGLGSNTGFFGGQLGEVCIWSKSNYGNERELADPGQRFELWYPLRSRKWMSIASGLPTLSLPTYVPGSLSSTGWRPQITAS